MQKEPEVVHTVGYLLYLATMLCLVDLYLVKLPEISGNCRRLRSYTPAIQTCWCATTSLRALRFGISGNYLLFSAGYRLLFQTYSTKGNIKGTV